MGKLSIIILTVFVLSGCNMQKYCAKRFPPEVKTEIKTVEKEVIRDTTVFIPVPGDVQYDSVLIPVPAPEFDYKQYRARAEVRFAKAESWLEKTAEGELKMRIRLEQKEQEIEHTIEKGIRERSTHTIEEREVVREVVVDSFFTRLYKWYFWVTLSLGAGFIFAKFKRII